MPSYSNSWYAVVSLTVDPEVWTRLQLASIVLLLSESKSVTVPPLTVLLITRFGERNRAEGDDGSYREGHQERTRGLLGNGCSETFRGLLGNGTYSRPAVFVPNWPEDRLKDESCWSDKQICRELEVRNTKSQSVDLIIKSSKMTTCFGCRVGIVLPRPKQRRWLWNTGRRTRVRWSISASRFSSISSKVHSQQIHTVYTRLLPG